MTEEFGRFHGKSPLFLRSSHVKLGWIPLGIARTARGNYDKDRGNAGSNKFAVPSL